MSKRSTSSESGDERQREKEQEEAEAAVHGGRETPSAVAEGQEKREESKRDRGFSPSRVPRRTCRMSRLEEAGEDGEWTQNRRRSQARLFLERRVQTSRLDGGKHAVNRTFRGQSGSIQEPALTDCYMIVVNGSGLDWMYFIPVLLNELLHSHVELQIRIWIHVRLKRKISQSPMSFSYYYS